MSAPSSPRLPTFAIRDLAGSGQPPGLISISRSQYDGTIKSQPDAKLLYVDEDDNELITVGSSLELSQRLDEPVLNYRQHPIDGKLLHIFDIKHTAGSLAEWRDHEAYSSKALRPRSPSTSSRDDGQRRYIDTSYLDWLDTTGSSSFKPLEMSQVEPKIEDTAEQKAKPESISDKSIETVTILSGINEHLSGLASVLQLAATTLQKAAEKTRTTDTSVVEDILKGVKDILTEVGSFGVEAYKDLHSLQSPAQPPISAGNEQQEKNQQIAKKLADEAMSFIDTSKSTPRVKFATVEDEIIGSDTTKRATDSAASSVNMSHNAANSVDKLDVNSLHILDDPSEDADFTARYPPLRSIRRARSTLDTSTRDYQPATRTEPFSVQYRPSPSPYMPPPPKPHSWDLERGRWHPQIDDVERYQNNEVPAKPVPGAWPDVKNDSAYSLPASTESSGAFFDRMTGRNKLNESSKCGIQRSHTTASSNPASRLNGPFDPGFAYERENAASKRPQAHTRTYHRADSTFRTLSDRISARDKCDSSKLDQRKSVPDFARSARRNPVYFDTTKSSSNSTDKDDWLYKPVPQHEPHDAVKHHRSVPQFKHCGPPFRPFAVPPPPKHADKVEQTPYSARAWGFPPRPVQPSPFWEQSEGSSSHTATPVINRPAPPPPAPAPPFAPYLGPADQALRRSTTISSTSPISPVPFTTRPTLLFPPRPAANTRTSSFKPNLDEFLQPVVEVKSEDQLNCYTLQNPFEDATVSPQILPSVTAPPPTFPSPASVTSGKSKFDSCVEQLQMCGFGIDDDNLKDRLHVYAVAADGNVEDAVEMIEEDRRLSAERFD